MNWANRLTSAIPKHLKRTQCKGEVVFVLNKATYHEHVRRRGGGGGLLHAFLVSALQQMATVCFMPPTAQKEPAVPAEEEALGSHGRSRRDRKTQKRYTCRTWNCSVQPANSVAGRLTKAASMPTEQDNCSRLRAGSQKAMFRFLVVKMSRRALGSPYHVFNRYLGLFPRE